MKLVEDVKDYASFRVILEQLEALQTDDVFYRICMSFFSFCDVCSADCRSNNPFYNDFSHPTNFVMRMTNIISLIVSCNVYSVLFFFVCNFSLRGYPKFVLKRTLESVTKGTRLICTNRENITAKFNVQLDY